MDAAAEKLTALKKAYADIILSISKEAAARVMASERKSVRYQHELKVAKEEGVRMLMRLKQMMDSQVNEAEVISLNQQKKIEELEAQLQEAEDIVKDLREELGEVQAELERIKSEDSNNLNESANPYSKEVPVENNNNISSYHSCKYLPPIESSLGSDARGAYIRNRDLPSIIVRGKDPGLYRNGCTQRIRACERNALDRDLGLSVGTHKAKDAKNGEQKEGAKMLSELEKKLLADGNLGTFKSFSRKKKRAVRQRKTVIVSGGKQSYASLKLDQLPEHSLASETMSADGNTHSAEDPSKSCLTFFQEKAELQTQLPAENDSENERSIMEIDGAKTLCEDEGESKRVEGVTVTGVSEGLLSPDCKKDVEKVDVPLHNLESNLPATTIGGRVIKITFQRKRKRQALSGNETKDFGETEMKTGEGKDGGLKLEQTKPSLVEESVGEHRQCGSEVNGSCETEMKTGDGQYGEQKVEQPKPSLSSRDRRRLAQVARQLISLSEKKWWH